MDIWGYGEAVRVYELDGIHGTLKSPWDGCPKIDPLKIPLIFFKMSRFQV